jgi:hypothetical protein
MRLVLLLVPFLLLAAGAAGCASKSPAESDLPPGVSANPNPPDPEAIRRRKQTLLEPPLGGAPSRFAAER